MKKLLLLLLCIISINAMAYEVELESTSATAESWTSVNIGKMQLQGVQLNDKIVCQLSSAATGGEQYNFSIGDNTAHTCTAGQTTIELTLSSEELVNNIKSAATITIGFSSSLSVSRVYLSHTYSTDVAQYLTEDGTEKTLIPAFFNNASEGDEIAVFFNDAVSTGAMKTSNDDYVMTDISSTHSLYKRLTADEVTYLKTYGLRFSFTGEGAAVQSVIINTSKDIWTYTSGTEVDYCAGKEIETWYTEPLFVDFRQRVEKGDVIRVYCTGTNEMSYACIKRSNWYEVMTGSDKFSIYGWEYYDVTVNEDLLSAINAGALIFGGYGHTISKVAIIKQGDTTGGAAAWTYGEVLKTQDNMNVTTGNWETSGSLPGSFFNISKNTQNNIIRVYYSKTDAEGSTPQLAVTDTKAVGNSLGSYTRWNYDLGSGYVYRNYINLDGKELYLFPMSDCITMFNTESGDDYGKPVVGTAGNQSGMLWKVLENGMWLGGNNITITKVDICTSQASKYISGRASFTHKLSASYWKPIALPYNLSNDDVTQIFGSGAKICELGDATVTGETTDLDKLYTIEVSFKQTTDGIKANYPYLIKLSGSDEENFTINKVYATTRDFNTYTFKTSEFKYGSELSEEKKAEYQTKLANAYLNFVSTAPVSNITVESESEVEKITSVDLYTKVSSTSGTGGERNYYFYRGAMYPINTYQNLKAGLAYVQMSNDLISVSNEAKMILFDDELMPTDIQEVESTTMAETRKYCDGIYRMDGTMVRRGTSTAGLSKGLYIVNGKKYFVR